MFTTIYHKELGPQSMYVVDANEAVARCPEEWSRTPWDQAPQKAPEAAPAVKADDGGVAIKAPDAPADDATDIPSPLKKK